MTEQKVLAEGAGAAGVAAILSPIRIVIAGRQCRAW